MKFQILIPTYNRGETLQKNLLYLLGQIKNYHLESDIGIIVSDNASTDETANILNDLISIFSKEGVVFSFYRNKENIGLEANAVQTLRYATAEYIIWCGDDDFLAEGFLDYVVSTTKKENIGWILTGAIAEYSDGTRGDAYNFDFNEKKFDKGYNTLLELSHYGHRMSGLVVKRAGLLESYLATPEWRNLYLFIYFLAYNQISYPGIFAPGYKTIVNDYNKKDFSYNSIGLLDVVFKSYNYLINTYGIKNVVKLLLRFVIMHSYRINFSSGFNSLIKQWRLIYKNYQFGKKIKVAFIKDFAQGVCLSEYLFTRFSL